MTASEHDQGLADLFTSMELPSHRVAQIESVVLSSLDRPKRPSLAAEWIGLLRVRPLSTSALALVGAAGIILFSPASGLLFGLLGQ